MWRSLFASICSSVRSWRDFVLAGRIADLRRAAADHDDRLVPAALQDAQPHDLRQIADVKAGRRAVEADIAGDAFLADIKRVEPLGARCIGANVRARRTRSGSRSETRSWSIKAFRVVGRAGCVARNDARPEGDGLDERHLDGRHRRGHPGHRRRAYCSSRPRAFPALFRRDARSAARGPRERRVNSRGGSASPPTSQRSNAN